MMHGFCRLIGLGFCLLVLSGCATQSGSKGGMDRIKSVENQHRVQTIYRLGKEHQNQERYAEAIAAYEEILELKPDFYDAYNGLGVIYSILGEHELAIQMISEAVRIAPLASYLYNNLGYAYMKQGLASEAAGSFQRALQIDPENVNARNNLLKAYQVLGCVEGKPCGQWQTPEYKQ